MMIGFVKAKILASFGLNDNFLELILWPYNNESDLGVGLAVIISKYLYSSLEIDKNIVELWTYQVHSDRDSFLLATNSLDRLKLFFKILNVQGIGPKTAITMVDFFADIGDLIKAILDKDTKTISKVPGLGPKTAAKLVVSLIDDIENLDFLPQNNKKQAKDSRFKLLSDTLINLGFSAKEASSMIDVVKDELGELLDNGASIEDQLKLVLRNR